MKKRFIILDGSSLLYRAFYALPLLTSGDGSYTNAIHGFSTMLLKLMQEWSPDLLVVAFDKGKKTFRNDLFDAYKGTRKPTPMELSSQIPLLHELMQAWGICLVEKAGYEADDIIGTLASKAAANGYDALVVTGDRDALQLVRPDLRVLLTRKGISDMDVYDEAAFREKYKLEPLQLIDLKGLMGDTSDNIPGVPGVGEKIAAKLLAAYGSVEEVLEHAEEVSGARLREKLIEHRELALLSKKLATIECAVPIDFDEAAYHVQPEREKLLAFCRKYGMNSVLRSLQKLLTEPAAAVTEDGQASLFAEAAKPVYFLSENTAAVQAFAALVREKGHFSFIGRYAGQVPSLRFDGIAVSCGDQNGWFSPQAAGWQILEKLLTDCNIGKTTFDLKSFYHAGGSIAGKVLDVELAAYLLDPSAGHYDLSRVFAAFCPEAPLPAPVQTPEEEAVQAVQAVEQLDGLLAAKLHEQALDKLYETAELPLVEVLASMEQLGVYVNQQHLQEAAVRAGERLEAIQKEIYSLAGAEFNLNSPKQLGEILFERLGLPVIKKTKTGYSTNAEVLEELRSAHPIVEHILSYRLWSKLKSTYLDSLGTLIAPETQRIHTHFNQTVTATGRLSSSDPNLQNIPVRTEEGRHIRTLFEPGAGYDYLLSADYSQIELRILAGLSQDKNFVEAFQNNEDIHARTASEVFEVPMQEVTPELRRRAKAVNFGIVYGISDYGLSRDLHISRKEAAGYIESYFKKCSGIKTFIDKVVADAHADGFVKTMLGRRRELPAIRSTNYNQRTLAERMAMNTPIQGSAADIIKLAMIAAWRRLREAGVRSRILLQVHDELVLEVVAEEIDVVSGILRDTMENVVELPVPLHIDINIGKNWAEAK